MHGVADEEYADAIAWNLTMWLKLTELTTNQAVLVNSERVCQVLEADNGLQGSRIIFSDACALTVKEPFDWVAQHLVDIQRPSAMTG